jgi:thioredoxin 2
MAPYYEKTASRLEPAFRFAKLNTQDEPKPAARFNIRSIPTLMVFRAGREIARKSGAMDTDGLTRWLSSV